MPERTERIRTDTRSNFCDCSNRAPEDWLRMSDANWRATYLPERDNVRAALDWALGAGGDSAIGIALAGASGPIWTALSLLAEGRSGSGRRRASGTSHRGD